MREIKFRGKRADNGEWVYGDLMQFYNNGHRMNSVTICSTQVDEVLTNTVGQFTGLHDKNGQEIYEGDIVKWTITQMRVTEDGGYEEYDSDEIDVIEWCNDALYVGEYCAVGFSYESEDYAEVLGNIHDNPELLNE